MENSERGETFLKLLVLYRNLHLKVASYSLSQTIVLSGCNRSQSSVMGISELVKHVPITTGLPSLVVVPGRVPGQGFFIGRGEVVLSDKSEDDFYFAMELTSLDKSLPAISKQASDLVVKQVLDPGMGGWPP